MAVKYDKPFKTYQEQIEIIKSRNISVEDEVFALEILSSISYYSLLNGYKDVFEKDGCPDQYKDGTKLETIYTLHKIQLDLNNIVFKYILYVEKSLKTKLAYYVSLNFGVNFKDNIHEATDNYLAAVNYSSKNTDRIKVLNRMLMRINEKFDKYPNAVSSYYKKNKNHVPAWILVNDLTLGQIKNWYLILKSDLKDSIANEMIFPGKSEIQLNRKEFFNKSLDLLNEYRNILAHGNKPFRHHYIVELPKAFLINALPCNVLNDAEYNNGIGRNDLFSVILSMLICLNDKYIISQFIVDLTNLFSPYIDLEFCEKNIFSALQIPDNLIDRMTNYLIFRFK